MAQVPNVDALPPQSEEFEVYSEYAENYMAAMTILEEMLAQPDVVQYFKVSQLQHFMITECVGSHTTSSNSSVCRCHRSESAN